MNSTPLKSVALGFLLVIAAGIAGADHPLFEKVDKNKDGKIDREEFAQYMRENAFEQLDKDEDKIISQSEWSNTDNVIDAGQFKEVFKHADKDRDKRISFPEFSSYAEKYSNIEDAFMILDKNKDGGLAPDEISYIPSFRWLTIHY